MKKLPSQTVAKITEKIRNTQLVMMDPASLKPSPYNARKHSKKQKVKLQASIEQNGFSGPLIVDEDHTLIAGHLRREVSAEMGLNCVPVVILKGLSEVQKRALILADNRIAELASWDPEQLIIELNFIADNQLSIDVTGFSTGEHDVLIDGLQARTKKYDPDDLKPEDCQIPSVTKLGDIWVFDGRHRLICGSALNAAAYQALMQDKKAELLATDPPYNVKISDISGSGKIRHKEFAMASGEMSQTEFTAFLSTSIKSAYPYLKENATAFVYMDWKHIRELLDAAEPVFGKQKQLCVWTKNNAGMGSFYRSQHELVFVFRKGDGAGINNFELGQHGRHRTNVWQYDGINSSNSKELLKLHPTVKPVAMIADILRDCSHRKGIVLDPFAGSGTILLAAERTGRCAYAIELDPNYCDTAIARWIRTAGKPVTLEQTGQTYEEVVAERLLSCKQEGEAV